MSDGISLGRRQVGMGVLARLGGVAMAAPPLAGSCGAPPPPSLAVRVPLANLTAGRRLRVLVQGRPVELMRTGSSIIARSLLCTHFGCEVRWQEAERIYRCLCHDGLFDAEGHVIGGPPKKPLRVVPVRVEGEEAVIG